MRAALYARVSTVDQSLDVQLAALRDYAKLKGYSIKGEYCEKVSGTDTDRPQLQKMLTAIDLGEVDIVLVYKLDRFARSIRDLVTMLERLQNRGCSFISLQDCLDLSTSAGRLMMHIVGAFAEFEASVISERTKAKLDYLKKQGKKLGPPAKAREEILRQLGVLQNATVGGDSAPIIYDKTSRTPSIRQLARKFGVSPASMYRFLQSQS